MARLIKISFIIALAALFFSSVFAQSNPELVALNIFVRGIQLPQGVRYTAAFIKPEETAALQNISVEITLPAEAQFIEMLVSRQVQFHVVRKNRQQQLTFIWQISRLAADQPLDSFSFTLAEPLTAELEFYMHWQTAAGEQRIENFFELPPLVNAAQTEAQLTVEQAGFVELGDTGVQVSAPVGTQLGAKVLPLDFNPPAEYGNIWWCSLLELAGLAPNTSAEVIMPLRRTLAPFTALQLFQQQADGSWLALAGQGVVTADGQYVMYTHPGGVVATGGPAEIQPAALPAAEIVIVEEVTIAPVVPPPAPITDGTSNTITDGTSNTVVISEAPITDGSSNTIVVGEVPPTVVPITDGSSNTIIVGEAPPTLLRPTIAPITDGSSNTIIVGEAPPTLLRPTIASITDGSSNTITISEATTVPSATSVKNGNATFTISTVAPTQPPALVTGKASPIAASTATLVRPTASGITDGTSNTIIVGEVPPTLMPPTIAPITDGSSNTIIIGEVTASPSATSVKNGNATFTISTVAPTQPSLVTGKASPAVVSTATLVRPTASGISDGSSNTIIISEATAVPPTSSITDGSSNTIIIGDATVAPSATSVKNGNATFTISTAAPTQPPALVTGKASPEAVSTATLVRPTVSGISDGSSNTISVNEPTATKAAVVQPTSIPPVFSPVVSVGVVAPFGAGGTRVEIKTSSSGVVQCQAGQVNCSLLKRRLGTGLR